MKKELYIKIGGHVEIKELLSFFSTVAQMDFKKLYYTMQVVFFLVIYNICTLGP